VNERESERVGVCVWLIERPSEREREREREKSKERERGEEEEGLSGEPKGAEHQVVDHGRERERLTE